MPMPWSPWRATLAMALALAACPAAGLGSWRSSRSLAEHVEAPPPQPLFYGGNGAAKVVFFAGLQGAGHRLLDAILKSSQPVGKQFSEIEFPKPAWACGHEWKQDGIAELQSTFAKLPRGSVHLLDRLRAYPECSSPPAKGSSNGTIAAFHELRKNVIHPRLDWVAQAARGAGVDLRVIYIHRAMEMCLAANCLVSRPPVEGCSEEADTLKRNAEVLHEQLSLLNPSLVHCFQYEEFTAMVQACADVFGKSSVHIQPLTQFLYVDMRPSDYALQDVNWSLNLLHMQPANLNLQEYCERHSRVTPRSMASLVRAIATEDP